MLKRGRILFVVLFTFSLLHFSPEIARGKTNYSRRTPIVEAVEIASPAVVNISAEELVTTTINPFFAFPGDSFFEEFFKDFINPSFRREYKRTSLGSGVIINKKGYIVTNHHVVMKGSRIIVTLADGRVFKAELVASSPKYDIAVLKINTKEDLPAAEMGSSKDLMIGETVIAIGNPFGLSHTVTTGVISALHRSIKADDTIYNDFIQTDASINPGNSGGPLLNINGQVIGINTAIYSKAQGIGFAIPIDKVKRVVDELIHYGKVRPAWLGIEVQDLSDKLAELLKIPVKKGVIITEIEPGSPADEAGIKRGDVICKMGDREIKDSYDFREALDEYTADDDIKIEYFRRGSKNPLKTALRAREFPLELAEKFARKKIGINVAENSPALANRMGLPIDKGVVVLRVNPGSPADNVGLARGDIIIKIYDEIIKNLYDFKIAIRKAIRRENVVMVIQRGRMAYYVVIPLRG